MISSIFVLRGEGEIDLFLGVVGSFFVFFKSLGYCFERRRIFYIFFNRFCFVYILFIISQMEIFFFVVRSCFRCVVSVFWVAYRRLCWFFRGMDGYSLCVRYSFRRRFVQFVFVGVQGVGSIQVFGGVIYIRFVFCFLRVGRI